MHLHLGRRSLGLIDIKKRGRDSSCFQLYMFGFCFIWRERKSRRRRRGVRARETEKTGLRSAACEKESFFFSFLSFVADTVDVFDRQLFFFEREREQRRNNNKKKTLPTSSSKLLSQKINQQKNKKNFSVSPSFLGSKMASHLASLGKVGPTIGEGLSSSKKSGTGRAEEGRKWFDWSRPPLAQSRPRKKKLDLAPLPFSRLSLSLFPALSRRPTLHPPWPPLLKTPSPEPPPLPPPLLQRRSSASQDSASSPSPGSSTTARASRSRRLPPTGSSRRRSGSGPWSARGLPAPPWSATRSGGAPRRERERERERQRGNTGRAADPNFFFFILPFYSVPPSGTFFFF